MGVAHTSRKLSKITKPGQPVDRVSREGMKIEKKKTIRQNYNMTSASAEAEAALFFLPVCFYIIPGTSKTHGQFLDQRQSTQAK